MLGKQQEYDVVPYFWSDLADWCSMEYVGPASEWDEVWIRGSLDEGKFTAFYVQGGRLAAALTVGRSDDLAVAARLLKEKTDITGMRARIEDPSARSQTSDSGCAIVECASNPAHGHQNVNSQARPKPTTRGSACCAGTRRCDVRSPRSCRPLTG